ETTEEIYFLKMKMFRFGDDNDLFYDVLQYTNNKDEEEICLNINLKRKRTRLFSDS
ncbi:hypothetical protein CWI38_0396p0010, partial [Hamiltosporidium tvaerminnensis]